MYVHNRPMCNATHSGIVRFVGPLGEEAQEGFPLRPDSLTDSPKLPTDAGRSVHMCCLAYKASLPLRGTASHCMRFLQEILPISDRSMKYVAN
jgi:hypothetical protein